MPNEAIVMIHRYEPGHGKGGEYMGMEETPTGHWCAWDDVQALLDERDQLKLQLLAASPVYSRRQLQEQLAAVREVVSDLNTYGEMRADDAGRLARRIRSLVGAAAGQAQEPCARCKWADGCKRAETALGLWRYWRTHDITSNEEVWASFTNAVYDLLEGKPVPERFVLDAEDAARVQARPCPPEHPDTLLLDAAIDLLVELGGALDRAIADHLLPGVTGKNARELSRKSRKWLAAHAAGRIRGLLQEGANGF